MSAKTSPRPMRRAVFDALLGLTLFVAFAFGLLGASGFGTTSANDANAAELARVAAFTGPMAQTSAIEAAATKPAIHVTVRPGLASSEDRTATVLLLAGVFAVLFSFNLAFFRHLRTVYAQPRQGRRNRRWSAPGEGA